MKKTKRLDPWVVVTLVILFCYLLFLIYPMFNLLRQSVFSGETFRQNLLPLHTVEFL